MEKTGLAPQSTAEPSVRPRQHLNAPYVFHEGLLPLFISMLYFNIKEEKENQLQDANISNRFKFMIPKINVFPLTRKFTTLFLDFPIALPNPHF